MLVYLDYLLVYSPSFQSHLDRLDILFKLLKQTGLKLKLGKCNFLEEEVRFLGHQISADGIATDFSKVAAVKEWPVMSTVKKTGFSKTTAPLHDVVNQCHGACSSAGQPKVPYIVGHRVSMGLSHVNRKDSSLHRF